MSATAKIEVSGLRVAARVGVSDEELRVERTIVIDVRVLTGRPRAARTDAIEDTIDYAALARVAAEIARGSPHRTLERLAARISDEIGERFVGAAEVEVRVRKPDPPLGEDVDFVAVTLLD